MIRKEYVIIGFLAFCLIAAIFVGVTSSVSVFDPWADITGDGNVNLDDLEALSAAWLTEGTPVHKKGNISVPAAAFVSTFSTDRTMIAQHLYNYENTLATVFVASVQLPHGATITNMTFLWYDAAGTGNVECWLLRCRSTEQTIAYVTSVGTAGDGSSSDDTINYANVDNNQYAYFLQVAIEPSVSHEGYYFKCAFIEYEYLP